MTSAFDVRGASKRYGERLALAPLTLAIERGETVAVVGPSGAGKTTLLHLLAGVIEADGGEVRLLGTPVHEIRSRRGLASRVGVLHQQFDLVPNLTVMQNVVAGNLGRWSLARSLLSIVRPQETARASEVLERVGLAALAGQRTSQLSGGEQQRVALARLLVQRPHSLLADEPVASLDPARATAVLRMLTDMAADAHHTLIASLHDPEMALAHFGRIIALRDGALVFDRPTTAVTAADLHRLYALDGHDAAPADAAAPAV